MLKNNCRQILWIRECFLCLQSGKSAEKTPTKPCDVEVYEKKIKLLEKQRKDVSLFLLLLLILFFFFYQGKVSVYLFPIHLMLLVSLSGTAYRSWRWISSGTFSGTPWSHSLNRRYSNDFAAVMTGVGRRRPLLMLGIWMRTKYSNSFRFFWSFELSNCKEINLESWKCQFSLI